MVLSFSAIESPGVLMHCRHESASARTVNARIHGRSTSASMSVLSIKQALQRDGLDEWTV